MGVVAPSRTFLLPESPAESSLSGVSNLRWPALSLPFPLVLSRLSFIYTPWSLVLISALFGRTNSITPLRSFHLWVRTRTVCIMSDPHPDKSTRVLSCVLCQQRKVRCDRTFPCTNCVKSQAQCVPAGLLPRRRKRRFPERELLDRVRQYETLLKRHDIEFNPLHGEPPREGDERQKRPSVEPEGWQPPSSSATPRPKLSKESYEAKYKLFSRVPSQTANR